MFWLMLRIMMVGSSVRKLCFSGRYVVSRLSLSVFSSRLVISVVCVLWWVSRCLVMWILRV